MATQYFLIKLENLKKALIFFQTFKTTKINVKIFNSFLFNRKILEREILNDKY